MSVLGYFISKEEGIIIKDYVCVIGGANLDICATPYNNLIAEDSNPGKIKTSFGGVGRNIAENLTKLGIQVELITAIADDLHSENLILDCKKKNIDISNSLYLSESKTSMYICINNENGNMNVAVSDMDIMEQITPSFLNTKMDVINNAKACVVDANIPEKTLHYLLDACNVPIFLDTVSVNKCQKLKNKLSGVHTIKPNLAEAELLSVMKIKNTQNLRKAAYAFFEQGIKQIFISMASSGVFYSDGKEFGILPCIRKNVINTNGAGDCFTAALVYAFLNNMTLKDTAKFAQAAAAICVTSELAVSEKLSLERINLLLNTEE